jgi:tetratricopeptide (TPR) repeat protein
MKMKMVMKISMLLLLAWPLVGFQGKQDRGDLYLKSADQMLAEGHPDKALHYLQRAIETNPVSTAVYQKRAFVYLQQKQREQALADFTRIIELTPKDGSAYVTRGLVYNEQRDWNRAAADFRKGCELGDADACTFLKDIEGAK